MLLGVNIDHIATLRQVRGTLYPDLIQAAQIAEQAKADSITIHLREDRRHIQDDDVSSIKQAINIPLNLEMAVTAEMIDIAQTISPQYCCLVPERREELTTEGGLDVVTHFDKVKSCCQQLKHIRVSLFIDPEHKQIEFASHTGASTIEIHTGHYANAMNEIAAKEELERIIKAVEYARSLGLQVNAGHGLNLDNVSKIINIPHITELNIGHSIISRALFVGLYEAVYEMKKLCSS